MIYNTEKMKKILRKLTGWMVAKTNYTPELPLPIQAITITPPDLKKFHAQHIVPNYEWYSVKRLGEPDCFVKQLKYKLVDELLKEIQIKDKVTPDGVIYSCDLLFKSI